MRPCDERIERTKQEWLLDSFGQLRLRNSPFLFVQWKGTHHSSGTCDDEEGTTSAKTQVVSKDKRQW